MSVPGDPVLWGAPSKEIVSGPRPSGPGPIPDGPPTGHMAASWKGRAMGRHRKPTAWDRIRLRMVKFRRRCILWRYGK
ncbi:hypothetical protein SHKM778_10000 [Streptomyces sp. KM77-8]|uniref:Transposase n=1 Tax=Streptomyces haneummycinicus TaxID=3074435 RepID=A0AAT9HB48_9ACTN